MDRKRNDWIDIAKTAGILGVVLQHAKGWAYGSDYIYRCLLFAVGLFVMLGGYNIADSYIRRGRVSVLKRLLNILVPYLAATLVYCIYSGEISDAGAVASHIIHFDAMAPLYYVAVYSQLMIITPVLIALMIWCDTGSLRVGEQADDPAMSSKACMKPAVVIRSACVWLLILAVCYATTNYTCFPGIIIGGGNLFAGPWLMFWFGGIYMRYHRPVFKKRRTALAVFTVDSCLLLLWHYLFVVQYLNEGMAAIFGSDQVPVTWPHAAEVLLLFVWFYTASVIWSSGRITHICGMLGRHSLYIFLFHVLFLEIYVTHFFMYMLNRVGRLNTVIFIILIIACPIAIEYIVKAITLTLINGRIRIQWTDRLHNTGK